MRLLCFFVAYFLDGKGGPMSLLLSFLVLLASIQGSNPPPASVESVLQVEQRFTAALMQRDDAEFGKLLADDLVHISFEGQSAGKTEYMAFFKQGAWRYTKYEPSDVKVKVLGPTSVVTGRVNRTIIVNNKETSGAFAFTHVWSRIGDQWRLTSSQVTTVPQQ